MKHRPHSLFLTAALLLLGSMTLITLGNRRKTVSYYEQRTLAAPPVLTAAGVWSGDYFRELEDFLSDHLAGRTTLLKADTALQLTLQRPNVNGVVVQSETLLPAYGFSRWELDYAAEEAEQAAARCAALRDQTADYGGFFCYLGLPRQSTYFADRYPAFMESRLWHTEGLRAAFSQAMDRAGVPFLDLHGEYERLGYPEDFYYKTDHHFTLQGAFAAYQALMERLRQEGVLTLPYLDREDFRWETLPNPFLGSSNRKLYGLRDTADTVELALPRVEIPFTRTDNGSPNPALYALPATEEETVTYSVYMGGDVGETVIRTHRPDRPSLLILGESFTNALETLL